MLAHFLDCTFSIPTAASPKPPSSLEGLSHHMYSSLGLLLRPAPRDPEADLRVLAANDRKLELAGYYHGCVSWAEAARLLARTPVGTFLVRDSEQSHYLYALSVQTRKGPTSCRIDYRDGHFRLDSAGRIAERMPRFDCVTDLVDHYVELTEFLENQGMPLAPVWLDLDECNTRDAPVQLRRPLYKRVPRLEHLCCMNVVQRLRKRFGRTLSRTLVADDPEFRTLPTFFRDYVNEYLFPSKECL